MNSFGKQHKLFLACSVTSSCLTYVQFMNTGPVAKPCEVDYMDMVRFVVILVRMDYNPCPWSLFMV